MNPYFTTRFIPSRIQHWMLICWVFWRNGCITGIFFSFFFQTFILPWIFVCQVAGTFSDKKIHPLLIEWPPVCCLIVCFFFQHQGKSYSYKLAKNYLSSFFREVIPIVKAEGLIEMCLVFFFIALFIHYRSNNKHSMIA